MSGIQDNLRYRAQRSTRLLNNHNKDEFGQQRGVVLFGFQPSPGPANSNIVRLGPGSVYTHNGQRIFVYSDITEVNIANASAFATEGVQEFIVVMQHNYAADTSINQPVFKAVCSNGWVPPNSAPVKDIKKMNIISGFVNSESDTLFHSKFNSIEGGTNFDSTIYDTEDKDNRAVGFDEIPLVKIIIDQLNHTNLVDGSGNFNTGVGIYTYTNPLVQLQDYLGFDYFEPTAQGISISLSDRERFNRTTINYTDNEPMISYTLNDGTNDVSHNYNNYGAYLSSAGYDPVNQPLYGYFYNDSGDSRYKYSSYLDDGHSIRWNMQKLSESVRVLESKVGSRGSESLTSYTMNRAPQTIADDINSNNIPLTYGYNFILKDGNVGWFKPTTDASDSTFDPASLSTESLADNHHTAIAMLDRGVGYISKYRLGLYGQVTGDGMDRDFLWNQDVPDGEAWSNTSLTAGNLDGRTFKSIIIDRTRYDLNRSGDYIYGHIHVGTDDPDYERDLVPGLNDEPYFNYQSISSNNTNIHIGPDDLVVEARSTDGNQYGVIIGPSETNEDGYGVAWPGNVFDRRQGRKSILGINGLAVTTKSKYDFDISVYDNSAIGVLNFPTEAAITISGNPDFKVFGKIVGSQTISGSSVKYNFILTSYSIQYPNLSIYTVSGNNLVPVWTGNTFTATLLVDGIGNADIIWNSYSTSSPLSGGVTFLDRKDAFVSKTLKIETDRNAPLAHHESYLPFQFHEPIIVGDPALVDLYASFSPNDYQILGVSISIGSTDSNVIRSFGSNTLHSKYSSNILETDGGGYLAQDYTGRILLSGNSKIYKIASIPYGAMNQIIASAIHTIVPPNTDGVPWAYHSVDGITQAHVYGSVLIPTDAQPFYETIYLRVVYFVKEVGNGLGTLNIGVKSNDGSSICTQAINVASANWQESTITINASITHPFGPGSILTMKLEETAENNTDKTAVESVNLFYLSDRLGCLTPDWIE